MLFSYHQPTKSLIIKLPLTTPDSRVEYFMEKYKDVDVYEVKGFYEIAIPLKYNKDAANTYASKVSGEDYELMRQDGLIADNMPRPKQDVDTPMTNYKLGQKEGPVRSAYESFQKRVAAIPKIGSLLESYEDMKSLLEEYEIRTDRNYYMNEGRLYEFTDVLTKNHVEIAKDTAERSKEVRTSILKFLSESLTNALTKKDDTIGQPLLNKKSVSSNVISGSKEEDARYSQLRQELIKQYGKTEGLAKSHELNDKNKVFGDAVVLEIARYKMYDIIKQSGFTPVPMTRGSSVPEDWSEVTMPQFPGLLSMYSEGKIASAEDFGEEVMYTFFKTFTGSEFKKNILSPLKQYFEDKGDDFIPSESDIKPVVDSIISKIGQNLNQYYFLTQMELTQALNAYIGDKSKMEKPVGPAPKQGFFSKVKSLFN